MSINIEKFTTRSREALMAAQQTAVEYKNSELVPLHLLSALFHQENGLVSSIIEKLGVALQLFGSRLDAALRELPHLSGDVSGQLTQSREFSTLLNDAAAISSEMHDEYVSVEHLLLAMFKNPTSGAYKLLAGSGIEQNKVLQVLQSLRGNQRVTTPDPENTFDALKKYSRDLTLLAMQDKLDPVIGRDEEIRRVIQIL